MFRPAAVLVASSVLAATTACSTPEATPPVECTPGRSSLTSLDPHTGRVSWMATLTQTSERPLQVEAGTVVVTAPCGAAVIDLADGDVRYDDTTPGDVVGVARNHLFTLDDPQPESQGGSVPVVGIDLDTSRPATAFSTNTPFQDAVVAGGSLVVMYGDVLEVVGETSTTRSWWTQIPAYRSPRLLPSGQLILVTADDGSTFAVDPVDGTLAWRSVPPVAATSYGLLVTTVPGTVLTAATTSDDQRRMFVYATDASTGRQRWTRPAVNVMAADRHLTVLRTATAVEAVDTVSGALRWRHPSAPLDLPGASPAGVPKAALTSDTVVVPQPGSPTLALERRTGRVRWRGPETSTAIADGDVVVTGAPEGVTAIDARTGAVRWSHPVERFHQELVVAPDGRLLLLDSDVVPHLGA